MSIADSADFVAVERERIRLEYERRAREIGPERYASSHPAQRFMLETRNAKAASMLRELNVFPRTGDQCLEVGFGLGGWLHELQRWGLRETDLHGIELEGTRAAETRLEFPSADLRCGDAVELPWRDGTFQLVIASTLFTSILDREVKRLIAREIERVLAPNGALLWYDFTYNNPRNSNVRGISRAELIGLFPHLRGRISKTTLAPPLARAIAPRSMRVANLLEAIPLLRTHLLAVLIKNELANAYV